MQFYRLNQTNGHKYGIAVFESGFFDTSEYFSIFYIVKYYRFYPWQLFTHQNINDSIPCQFFPPKPKEDLHRKQGIFIFPIVSFR